MPLSQVVEQAVSQPMVRPRRWVRISIRSALLAIVVMAIIVKGAIWSRKATQLRAASERYELQFAYFQEGRVLASQLCVDSEAVLEKQFDMCEFDDDRIAALEAHLARVTKVVDEERRFVGMTVAICRGCPDCELLEAMQCQERIKAQLSQARTSARTGW
jgi:hypothetical protein